MEALCLDILNSDWRDYRGTGQREDRLLKSGWIEGILARWGLGITNPPGPGDIAALQELRTRMLHIVQAILQKQPFSEQQIAALNSYFDAAPSRPQLIRVGEQGYRLRQMPFNNDWNWVLSEVARSFAALLVDHDPTRIKQCENPDCRWIYYDESANQTRRWCDPPCANLMRVRRFRARHHQTGSS